MSSLAAAGVRCDQGRRMSHWRLYLWVHTQPHRPRAHPGAGPQAPWPLCPARTHLGPSAGPRTHGIGVAVPKAMPSLAGKGLGSSLSSRLQSPRSSLPRAGFPLCHIRPFSGRLSWAPHWPSQHRARTSTVPRSLLPCLCLSRRHVHAFLCGVCGVDLLCSLLCLFEVLCQLREGTSLSESCTEAGTTVAWEENGGWL